MYTILVGIILLSLIFIIIFYIFYKYKYYEYHIFIPLVISSIIIIYLIYKSKIIEGNIEKDIFYAFNESLPTTDEMDFPLNKFSKILKILTSQLTNQEKYGDQEECKGNFVLNKLTNKTCGQGFNERVYKITSPGDNCLHTELYKEKVPLRLCNYDEKCNIDVDCKSERCDNGFCSFDLQCNPEMTQTCDFDGCMNLNDKYDDIDKYIYKDDKCTKNPCNKDTYVMCNDLDCEKLGYEYKYNTEDSICEKMNLSQSDSNVDIDDYNARLTIMENLKDKWVCSNIPSSCGDKCSENNCYVDTNINNITGDISVKQVYTDKNNYYVYENGICNVDKCIAYLNDGECIPSKCS